MGFFKQTITSVPLENTTVLVRVDYNVPLEKNGEVADDFRIRASLPTLQKLLDEHCKVVLISHLGRPEGRDEALSLAPIAKKLEEILGRPIIFIDDVIGDKVKMGVKRAPKNSVILLENVRFYSGEEANDAKFARDIAEATGARYFVQDAFGDSHRAHASTDAITQFLPGVAGLLLQKEYETITSAMKKPERPLVAVIGGAKIKDKISLIHEFVRVSDTIIIGGAMANTFLAYRGLNVGKSKYESQENTTLDELYKAVIAKVGREKADDFLVLPTDVAVSDTIEKPQKRQVVSVHDMTSNSMALDIGDASIDKITKIVEKAKTVVWNGTLGYAELPEFSHGSARLALALATHQHVTSIIGGGDTSDFALHWDARKGGSFTHVSTGGGASLELMAGEKLPGIESLLDAER